MSERPDTRERIAERVRADPGVHFNELVRTSEFAPGQLQHHLGRLESVVAESVGGRTHYFPEGYDAWERRALALLRRETAGDVVAELLAESPRRPAELAATLDVARSTLEHHLDRLAEHDLVVKRRDDRGRVRLEPARPEATLAMLREADPHLVERMVDRFARLVDHLLE
jgi:predicted transcriptional regulator